MTTYHHGPPQYNPNPVQGEEQYSEPGRAPLSVDNKQGWRHQSHQAGEWKWPGGRGIGQEVKQRDNPPLFVPPSGIVKTVISSYSPSPTPPGSELKVGAAEFVPGGGCTISDLGSGINLGIDGGVQGWGAVESSTLSNVDHHSIEPLEVGKATVGPVMSEMYETEYVDDGFDWSMGTSSLAVLPHRYIEQLLQQ